LWWRNITYRKYDSSDSHPSPLCFSMEGGELFQRIQDRQDGAFTERGK